MNEINQTPSVNTVVTQKATQPSTQQVSIVRAVDNIQPADTKQISTVQNEDETKKDAKPSEAEVNSALDDANAYVQNIQRDLVFSVDKDLDQTVIKVVESESGKVIRQIPEDVFLELAKNLETGGELNLVNTSS